MCNLEVEKYTFISFLTKIDEINPESYQSLQNPTKWRHLLREQAK